MRPLITSALIVASLALAGNGAMAADTYAKTGATAAPAHAAVRVAARHRYPVARYTVARRPVDVVQIVGSLLASQWLAPYVAQYAGKIRTTRRSSGGTYEPYDRRPTIPRRRRTPPFRIRSTRKRRPRPFSR